MFIGSLMMKRSGETQMQNWHRPICAYSLKTASLQAVLYRMTLVSHPLLQDVAQSRQRVEESGGEVILSCKSWSEHKSNDTLTRSPKIKLVWLTA